MSNIILGTKNPNKVVEISKILGYELGIVPDHIPVSPETHETYAENAAQKAAYYAKKTGHFCLADDSGLEVDALGGIPGVHSAHYAGENATPNENCQKLLDALKEVPAPRTARYRCFLALSDPAGNILATSEGTVEGLILTERRGKGGFAFDPIFEVNGKTLAELSLEEKSLINHRGQAVRKMRDMMEQLVRPCCGGH